MKKLLLLLTLGMSFNMQAVPSPEHLYLGKEMITTPFIVAYQMKAGKIVKTLQEQLDQDDETDAFIKKTITALNKGANIMGIMPALGLLGNKGAEFISEGKSDKYNNLMFAAPEALKAAIISYYVYSLSKDIKMIEDELAKNEDENPLNIEDLDVALSVLKFGRTLGYSLIAANTANAIGFGLLKKRMTSPWFK